MPSHPEISIFMCGDVMTGRGIDQILPNPGDPHIHEPWVRDARRYVELAEAVSGQIQKPVNFAYIWGDAIDILERMAPDVKIINLETGITTCDDYWKGKGINYRMHPRNISCLTAAGIDVCTLANNHVLDWGYGGLLETLQVLKQETNMASAGAGRNLAEAAAPAVMEVAGKGRAIVFSLGFESSGIPTGWAAGTNKAGVNLLPDFTDNTVSAIQSRISVWRRPGDIVVASIHWGGNWGYAIPARRPTLPITSSTMPAWILFTGIHPIMPRGSRPERSEPVLRPMQFERYMCDISQCSTSFTMSTRCLRQLKDCCCARHLLISLNHKKFIRSQTGGQHHHVDFPMLSPAVSCLVFIIQPEALDLLCQW